MKVHYIIPHPTLCMIQRGTKPITKNPNQPPRFMTFVRSTLYARETWEVSRNTCACNKEYPIAQKMWLADFGILNKEKKRRDRPVPAHWNNEQCLSVLTASSILTSDRCKVKSLFKKSHRKMIRISPSNTTKCFVSGSFDVIGASSSSNTPTTLTGIAMGIRVWT